MALATALLAGCDPMDQANYVGHVDQVTEQEQYRATPSEESRNAPAQSNGQTDRATSVSRDRGQIEGRPPAKLPPAQESYRFVGRWAANEAMCASQAWRFAADKLTTPAGSVCTFKSVRAVAGGYELDAHCVAEGSAGDDTLGLRFAESARAMLFTGRIISSVGLIYCGPLAGDRRARSERSAMLDDQALGSTVRRDRR